MLRFCAVFFALMASAAVAQSAAGVWRTQADDKGQTALVTAQPCGDALCGVITQVMSPQGQSIAHPNVGRRVFWDMRLQDDGLYHGRAFVPAFNADFRATMRLQGPQLTVRGCAGPVCKSQVWQRVR